MQLHRWLGKALQGMRQVVFVMGEPGIGKTTLIDTFLEQVASTGGLWIGRGQCVEHYGASEAYLPVLEALGQLCRQPSGEQLIETLRRHAPTWLAQMPGLMSDTELEAVQRRVQGTTRERMLRELTEAIEALPAATPLVLVLEDLHWSDYSTLDLLALLAQRRGPARLLLLGTYRPADVIMSGHPLKAVKQELQVHGRCEEMQLGFLTIEEVNQYLAARFPQQQFPAALGQIIHQSTEGNPLFMVNVVDYWISHEVLVDMEGQWQLVAKVEDLAAGVPESLRQMIEKQLEGLTPEEQRIVEAASVVGGEFATATVAAGLEEQRERIEERCEGLAERGQFLRARGIETFADETVTGRYGFLHALYQQVLYERLTVVRRVHLHRRIGDWEEGAYGKRVSEVAAELAMHFERGQDYERAVRYLTQAGENALRRSAPREAIDLLTKGLELLQTLSDTPERLQQKLTLQITLGKPLWMTKGFAAPEVERVYTQARELCRQIGETPLLFPALFGLFPFYLTRAQYKTAHELAEQLMRLAQATQDPILLLGAHWALGTSLLYFGKIDTAETHTQEGLVLYNPQQQNAYLQLYGQDLGVVSRAQGSWALWLLGYPDQALQRAHDALTLAQKFSYPFSVAFALHYVALMHQVRRENQAAAAKAEFAMKFANEQGFPFWLALATMIRGGELAEQGNGQEGIMQMRQGLDAYRALGADIGNTYWVGFLAEKYGKTGQAAEGLAVLAEAFTLVNKNGERWWEAELYRLKGTLTLQQFHVSSSRFQVSANQKAKGKGQRKLSVPNSQLSVPSTQHPTPSTRAEAEAEECFLKAIEIARQQQAKSLELRATMSLARLWQRQGKQHEARNILSEIYSWFTEGFDTPDLQEAKAFLNEEIR
jgi:predicted ATPase